ncbi:helix-turn-helix domain-containing protein, partial [Streptomyces boncukensis]
MDTVALAATDGMLHFELALAYEVFGSAPAGVAGPWYDVAVCGPGPVRVGRFLLEPDHGLDRLSRADTVIVPGWADVDADASPGTRPSTSAGDPTAAPMAGLADLVDAVRAAHEAGARVASLCTGAFVLAAAGLLDGKRATTHWAHTRTLAARYPRVEVDPDVLYTDSGSVLTSAGKAAALDLCLHLVRLDHGSAAANAAARRLVVPPHRDGGQAQFVTTPMPAPDNRPLAELLPWVLERLDQPLTVEDLARQARMSARNLGRHFRAATGTTPLQWLLTQRIRRAQELLETTDDSVETIAAAAGMGTATTLRRHFTRTVGVP